MIGQSGREFQFEGNGPGKFWDWMAEGTRRQTRDQSVSEQTHGARMPTVSVFDVVQILENARYPVIVGPTPLTKAPGSALKTAASWTPSPGMIGVSTHFASWSPLPKGP